MWHLDSKFFKKKSLFLIILFYLSPVPSYNWTRKDGQLPKHAYLTSFNRVLIIPKVRVEDEGEYICRAYNDRASTEHSVVLNIQGTPQHFFKLFV